MLEEELAKLHWIGFTTCQAALAFVADFIADYGHMDGLEIYDPRLTGRGWRVEWEA